MDLEEVGRDCRLVSSYSEYYSVTGFRVQCNASLASMNDRQFDYLSAC
jgi:hypothetical protein